MTNKSQKNQSVAESAADHGAAALSAALSGDEVRQQLAARFAHVCSGWTNAQAATFLGVSPRSVTNYVNGVRSPDADVLARIAKNGWNVNWLLTGEGPERLDQFAAPQSQSGRSENITLAVQLLREAEEVAGRPPQWTPEQQGEATAILVRLLEIGTATAEVRSIARQQMRLFSGGIRDGAPGSGAEGVG